MILRKLGPWLAGAAAGAVNGLFGAGGGMVLIPGLKATTGIDDKSLFPCSVAVMLPISLVSLLPDAGSLPWSAALPYLIGGGIGGIFCGMFGKKIPVKWLHRVLGLFILWGGVRYLWGN